MLYAVLEKNVNTFESTVKSIEEEEGVQKDPADLMFTTEIDVDAKPRKNSPNAERFEDVLDKAHA